MQQLKQFKKPEGADSILRKINDYNGPKLRIMEICGTHTMAIAKSGLKTLLRQEIELISGPGCPVCVTPQDRIDSVLSLCARDEVIIATYGDMLRVPGTKPDASLQQIKALGGRVEIVYSAMDSVELAQNNPNAQVVFLGIGFETTTPSTAVAVKTAADAGLSNYSVFSMHKLCEPILRTLIEQPDFDVDAFICPGNVSIILGEQGFEFLGRDYGIPAVIAGFESGDILAAVYQILQMKEMNNPALVNEYIRAVTKRGNEVAQQLIHQYFEPCSDLWRGIGVVPGSGLRFREEYSKYDAVQKFHIELKDTNAEASCECGEILKGKQSPADCRLFGTACTPERPIGPCMVSSEGACSARYKYGNFNTKK